MAGPFHSLRSLAASLAARHISPAEVLDEISRCHDEHGARTNAYIVWRGTGDDGAATDSRPGPLTGIPVSVKDCIGVQAMPTFAGTARRLPDRWEREGPVVSVLRQQSAIVVGKTVQTEFALSALGLAGSGPQPRNPWDAEKVRSAGGSSTGAGLSLLEGSALLALGTDSMGSVRIPASAAGVVGLKTSVGRWPADGIVPLSPTFDTVGLLANSVDDMRYAFAAFERALGKRDTIEAKSEGTAAVRIGVPKALWAHCDDSIARVAMLALDDLAANGASLLDLDCPEAGDAFAMLQEGALALAEFDAFLSAELPEFRDTISPPTAALVERGSQVSARDYLHAMARRRDIAASAFRRFALVDVMAWPTIPLTPPIVGELDSAEERRNFHLAMLRNTCAASTLGLCSISLPVGLDIAGIPVGLEFIAPGGCEEQLLAVADAFERQFGPPRQRIGTPPLLAPALETSVQT